MISGMTAGCINRKIQAMEPLPDAWIDEGKYGGLDGDVCIVGFEILFNRHFYVFEAEDIDCDLKICTDGIKRMIVELSA